MKKLSLTVTLVFTLLYASYAQNGKAPEPQIRQYWFVLLTQGPNRSQDSVTAAKLQEGHLANILRLYMEGKVKVAGPFGEEGDPVTATWQGIFIFDCETKAEVEKLLATDPAIAAGRMLFHIKPWYTVPVGSFEPGKPKKPLF